MAVITFCPFAKVGEIEAVACAKSVLELIPPVTATAFPKLDPFSKNCTVPVGSCDALAVALLCVDTVAVKVTGVPVATAVWLAATDVVVLACATVITPMDGPLLLKLLSPR